MLLVNQLIQAVEWVWVLSDVLKWDELIRADQSIWKIQWHWNLEINCVSRGKGLERETDVSLVMARQVRVLMENWAILSQRGIVYPVHHSQIPFSFGIVGQEHFQKLGGMHARSPVEGLMSFKVHDVTHGSKFCRVCVFRINLDMDNHVPC